MIYVFKAKEIPMKKFIIHKVLDEDLKYLINWEKEFDHICGENLFEAFRKNIDWMYLYWYKNWTLVYNSDFINEELDNFDNEVEKFYENYGELI
jgi:hypothetical protein